MLRNVGSQKSLQLFGKYSAVIEAKEGTRMTRMKQI